MTLLRHLLSILILPFTVTVLLPLWLLGGHDGMREAMHQAHSPVAFGLGVLLLLVGLFLFGWCALLFARVGKGTLAPWDPTKELVAAGPYRYVRNPMITSVATILAAQALIFQSRDIAILLLGFVALNHVYFILSEEPGLRRRFGTSYEEYARRVPRWLPRVRGRGV